MTARPRRQATRCGGRSSAVAGPATFKPPKIAMIGVGSALYGLRAMSGIVGDDLQPDLAGGESVGGDGQDVIEVFVGHEAATGDGERLPAIGG